MKNWWVVYKVNPQMDIHRCDAYAEIEQHQCFTVSDGAGLAELATCDVELMEEEPGPSKKRI
jgi:hypothetical protein